MKWVCTVLAAYSWGNGRPGMVIKVRCQQCGKSSQFSASDAGMTALCVACGGRFTIPSPGAEGVIPDHELKDAAVNDSLTGFVAGAVWEAGGEPAPRGAPGPGGGGPARP